MAKKDDVANQTGEVKDGSLTPESLSNLKKSKPSKNSVGFPAITSVISQTAKYMRGNEAIRTMFQVNQKGGFDCPGCAWPDPEDERSKLGEYCENGMKAIAEEAQKKIIGATFFSQHTIEELSRWTDFELGKQGRLAEPMFLPEGADKYKPITWDKAFEKLGTQLKKYKDPNEAVFYTSGRTSNEAAYLYQLFVRAYGTNNMPDCSNMCHESTGSGLSETLGIGKGSVTLPDLYEAELIIVMGQNPGTNHPRMLSALEKCKENGGKIISINPIKEAGLIKYTNPQRVGRMLTGGLTLTDLYLQVRINEDVALLKAFMLLLLKKEKNGEKIFDQHFIEEKTDGYEDFIADLEKYDLKECISRTGISEKAILEAVDLIASSEKIIICWAMGLTQHVNAIDNIRELVNLLLLKGAIGKPGAGTCPVRGHSNVQGDRTVGVWDAPTPELIQRLQNRYQFDLPKAHGYNVVEAIKAMHEKKAKFFFAMGGNFLSATPDTLLTAKALRNCDMTVHVSTKLNRSHLVHGKEAMILPCLGRTEVDIQTKGEQFVSVENSVGIVHQSQGILEPCSKELLSEVAIVCKLAQATLPDHGIDWTRMNQNYDLIRNEIEATIPGFDDYNRRVREPGGFYLPNGARIGEFKTDVGKAKFTVNQISEHTLNEGELMMMTVRSHDQFNTTIYGMDDRYRGVKNERRIIFMNPSDIQENGFKEFDVVDISSNYDGENRVARKFIIVSYDIPRSNCATYFPEANVLVPIQKFARKSMTPASKSIIVRVKKHLN